MRDGSPRSRIGASSEVSEVSVPIDARRRWWFAMPVLWLVFGMVWTFPCNALPNAPGPHPVALAAPAPPHLPFYVARKGNVVIYLLGTLHVGEPSDYPEHQPFRLPIANALGASRTLALELSPDEVVRSQDDVSHYGVCSRLCLPRLVPPFIWHRLKYRFRNNPTALTQIGRSRPWLAALLVSTYDTDNDGLDAEYGSEVQLEQVYHGRIVGLERISEQIASFTRLSSTQQIEMLAQNLVQTPRQNAADVLELHRLWRIGDADAMAAWQAASSAKLARSLKTSNSIDEEIVYSRNRRFVARMLRLSGPRQPVFVAVGALHLGGRRGVLALLGQQGFEVRWR
jgi:uncharacterized protein YbaP (TraB family)